MNELRLLADLTNIPTSGRQAVSCSVTRTNIATIAVKSYIITCIRHDKQLFSCLDRKSK